MPPLDDGVEVAFPCRCALGEGPLWDPGRGLLYWSDIPRGVLHRLDPAATRHAEFPTGGPVGGLALQADGSLLLFMEDGAVRSWRDGDVTTVLPEIPAERGTRFNDVIADPAGRVFAGTMPGRDGRARLYRLDPDGTLSVVLDGLALANGMGFTPDRRGLYVTDTGAREIRLHPYDPVTGDLGAPRVFARVPDGDGAPDGLTVDEYGRVWSARWGGGCVVCHAPDGTELRRVTLPVPKVTSVAFGGADGGDLYVTTAGGGEPGAAPNAGSLFRLRPGVRGGAEFRSGVLLRQPVERAAALDGITR